MDVIKNECNITPIFVPAGGTSIIQPLDVSYNAPFKKKVEAAAAKHMNMIMAYSYYTLGR